MTHGLVHNPVDVARRCPDIENISPLAGAGVEHDAGDASLKLKRCQPPHPLELPRVTWHGLRSRLHHNQRAVTPANDAVPSRDHARGRGAQLDILLPRALILEKDPIKADLE